MSFQTPPKSLLIADDEPENLDQLFDLISEHYPDCEVLKAGNGEMAYKIAEKWIPDIVITDWEMPKMTGIELITALKANPKTEEIPVIVFTGVMTSSINLEMALSAGAADYIRKPVDAIELRARVNSMLRLSQEYRKVKELNRTKDQIFSIISHDLRSPINSLGGTLEVFELGVLEPTELNRVINALGLNIRRLSGLLDNLLHWAKSQVENGKITINHEQISVQSVLEESRFLLEDVAKSKEIDLLVIKPLVDLQIWADKEGVKLILRNLMSNAIKYTSKGGRVEVEVAKEDDKVRFFVKDTGKGIEKEIQETLFNDFVQSKPGTSGEKGTGLGLMLCKLFAEAQGGEIGFTPNVNHGSEFWFTLPLAENEIV